MMVFSRFDKTVMLGDRLESVSGPKTGSNRTLGDESLTLGRSRCKDKAGKVRLARLRAKSPHESICRVRFGMIFVPWEAYGDDHHPELDGG